VVIFEEDTPYNLIKQIKPNILVKGSDYSGKDIVGEDIVEELVLVEFIEGRSSTNTIKKMKKDK
jgi:D-beta-D-heptose 7-phosphate kinase/D-beta-D-heptose 1-phosphate adenosyltransferase